jgi:MHS family shikimate/dehydroshikimate transporter-like MFS transporter
MADTRTAGSKMRSIVFASSVGTIIEWYDFLIYATAAALVFNKAFFPTIDPLAGTLAALGTYAVGFLARPLGGALFGHFGDRLGRKSMLVLTMFIMGLSTFGIGLLPNYASIGVLAPLLLILLRIVQGIGLGGEWGGASLMVIEHSPADKRGFYGSFVQIGFPSDWCSQRWSLRLRPNFPKPISSPGAGAFLSLPASFCWRSARSFDPEFRRRRCSRE